MDPIPEINYGSLQWWREVVDLDVLQEIIDSFAKSLQCGAVLTTLEGVPITQPSNFTSFCRTMRTYEQGRQECRNCDAQAGRASLDMGRFRVYRCVHGLIDMASPVVVEGRRSAVLLLGQIKLRDYSRAEVEKIARTHWGFVDDTDDVIQKFMAVPVVDQETVNSGGALLRIVAANVVNLCERRLTERRLLEKSLALMREQRDKEALERNLKYSQVKSLQRQLNPHFMFNTLNTISRLAMFEDAPQTQELTLKFAEYLRYVLRKQTRDEMVPLGQELDCIAHYLAIFKVRFGDRLTYEISATPEAKALRIPFMLLQPIVENAILHGLEPSPEPGHIRVEAQVLGCVLVMTVDDNGVGCDLDQVRSGLGTANVQERLHLYFGGAASIQLESKVSQGTHVRIRVPAGELMTG